MNTTNIRWFVIIIKVTKKGRKKEIIKKERRTVEKAQLIKTHRLNMETIEKERSFLEKYQSRIHIDLMHSIVYLERQRLWLSICFVLRKVWFQIININI